MSEEAGFAEGIQVTKHAKNRLWTPTTLRLWPLGSQKRFIDPSARSRAPASVALRNGARLRKQSSIAAVTFE
jgi:hypothetical protein